MSMDLSNMDKKSNFLHVLKAKTDFRQREVAEKIINFLEKRGLYEVWYGDGERDKSCIPRTNAEIEVFTIWSYGRISIPIEMMKKQPFWREEANQRRVTQRFESFVELNWGTASKPKKNPTIELSHLTETRMLEEFKNATIWLIGQIKN
jgi:hypothetical protein